MINRIMAISSVPIVAMNWISPIIGGIWLLILGDWRLVVYGVLWIIFSLKVLIPLALPSLGFALIGGALLEKIIPIAIIFVFLSFLLTNVLIIGTCFWAFTICSSFYYGDNFIGYIPYLFWSYSLAVSPWQNIAAQELDNPLELITAYSVSMFYLLFLITFSVSTLVTFIIIALFCLVHLIVLPTFGTYLAYQMEQT